MNRLFMAAAFAVSLLIASTPVEAKTKHLSLNHTTKHVVGHKSYPVPRWLADDGINYCWTARGNQAVECTAMGPPLKIPKRSRKTPRNGQGSGFLDVAALPSYQVKMTRSGMRARAEPMGRKHIAPSNGYTMASEERVIGGRPAGCPHRYCGCSASLRVFGRIIAELNLAANWRKFPSAAPAPGMAAWRYGHVFVIESVNGDGTVLAHDGNSGGGLTRMHTISLRGYRIVNPNGATFSARRITGGQS